ncbi:MAG: metal-sensitive transcriptional regulator [Candidatus Wildermuthbacteria bacterium]|nr:metal-sensitive transcriptional regulator [Candidatus Wildermuthbacteria bacterium]
MFFACALDTYTPQGYYESMHANLKHRALHRLKILEGQVRGIRRMVEQEEYCIDILRQSSAVREAVSSVEDLLLENHLSIHLGEQMAHGNKKKAIAEVVSIFQLSKKK